MKAVNNLHFSLQLFRCKGIPGLDAGLDGKLLYGSVSQRLGTTKFTNLIG